MQAELFRKDQWGVAKCPKCGALGTIVELRGGGICCRIQLLQNSAPAKLESRGSLSTNDSDTTSHERKVAR